uniref:Uncharacterized protein n=1 Tax=Romanomermis culicivorax TaxID=13658 RepID=A0A915IWR5_ROMCU
MPAALSLNSMIPEAARVPQIAFRPSISLCRLESRMADAKDENFVDATDPNEDPARQTFLFSLPVLLDNSHVNFSKRMLSAKKCFMDTRNPSQELDACFCLGDFLPPALLIMFALSLVIQYAIALVIICKISTNLPIWPTGVRLLIGLAVYNGILLLTMGCLHILYISIKQESFYYTPFSWMLAAVLAYAAAFLTAIEALLWSKINSGIELFP